MRIQQNIPLAPYTTLKVGGAARLFVEAGGETEILDALRFAREERIPVFVLGGGSNLLVHDSGFDGLVIRIALKGIAQQGHTLTAAAGEEWDALVQLSAERNLQGIECLAGIPGTVGGTPVQNVGAYGQEVAQTITQVRTIDRATLTPLTFTNAECGFAYRRSRFNHEDIDRYIVTAVSFRLLPGGAPSLAYADLQRAFLRSETPSLMEVATKVRKIRATKGMVLIPGDADTQSAGSFFKNPVVPPAVYEAIADGRASVPHWPAPGGVKLSAAWLLEASGFHKGFTLGQAGLSTKHALALTNRGGATAAEILALRDHLQAAVEARFGIRLEQEPVEP
ncbi:UDP-N-acetylmuramate dehydrogenase [Terriglobus albidus]|uniref:UDP-N-acetylenolpyruvoylglucosamine reductase n=1 Tax=Terriglobus albidus TaxID=1592106 RepID=A0A5B9EHB4_9BACT|nr:UDP-N-acetylmuramate dehydrogenase [Terriglobus albidus]QEE29456.1 UDP-N-acetylmuramate dehydrogenase [Terriglobus albidus]